MSASKVIGLDAYTKQLKKELLMYSVEKQTENLIDYAEHEIRRVGDLMSSYNGANHMDRTGNLLNSLCWGVSYDGVLKASGFYREPVINARVDKWGQKRGKGMGGSTESYLHEYFDPADQELVNGRQLAEEFLKSYSGKSKKWTVFFAVLAPYWGYWEGGFRHIKTNRRMQFQVMSHIFDEVRRDLRPATTNITVYRPKYSYRHPKYKKRVGYKKIGVIR